MTLDNSQFQCLQVPCKQKEKKILNFKAKMQVHMTLENPQFQCLHVSSKQKEKKKKKS